ncbi:methyltransferase family protein [Kribbella antiqua]|uniref:Methyltransferase family protein n=2 Tax=Kribbella antiqua TaxID=2512217 RepID=A0A4R2IA63_9ACTN|nr:methyltransferase family protein [Kribbella antiqua]
MLELARAQVPEAQFVLGDMRHLSFSPNEFDAVTAYFSLLMLSRADMAALLTEVRAWLRRGGLLSFSLVEFDADSVEVEFMGTTFQASGYTEAQLPAVLEHAGYEVVSLRTVDHAPIEGPSEAQVFCLARPLENR